MGLCATCGSGSRCLTHDANRQAIDIGQPATVVGLTFDAALDALGDDPDDGWDDDGWDDDGWDDDGEAWPDDVVLRNTETIQPSEAYL